MGDDSIVTGARGEVRGDGVPGGEHGARRRVPAACPRMTTGHAAP
ncbi:hypothetical protein [Streptomyces sp. 130]|nr:hypothetical protein [Streptomyces sp. 130]